MKAAMLGCIEGNNVKVKTEASRRVGTAHHFHKNKFLLIGGQYPPYL